MVMAGKSPPSGQPKTVPLPRSSRIRPMATSAPVKPAPIPSPSRADSPTLLREAKASARPRMMQLTTIRGR